MNRVEKFNLNAAKAYEFARGVLVEKNDKLVYVYARAASRPGYRGYLHLDLVHKPIKRKNQILLNRKYLLEVQHMLINMEIKGKIN